MSNWNILVNTVIAAAIILFLNHFLKVRGAKISADKPVVIHKPDEIPADKLRAVEVIYAKPERAENDPAMRVNNAIIRPSQVDVKKQNEIYDYVYQDKTGAQNNLSTYFNPLSADTAGATANTTGRCGDTLCGGATACIDGESIDEQLKRLYMQNKKALLKSGDSIEQNTHSYMLNVYNEEGGDEGAGKLSPYDKDSVFNFTALSAAF
jgi:hypothetical protein